MNYMKNKRDYYESRPLIYISVGFFGLLAPMVIHPGASFFRMSIVSSIVLFVCAYKVIQMRKNYRRQRLPIK